MDWFKGHATYPIKQRTDLQKPLFLFVAMQAMHTPSPGPEVLHDLMKQYRTAGHNDARFIESNALITLADQVLEYTVTALRENLMWDSTLLVHLSDNGGQVVPNAMDHLPQGSNWPLRGMKRSYFEGGVRVPAFVAGGALPITARGKMINGYIHIADWFATLSEVAGMYHEYTAATDDLQSGSISMAEYIAGGGVGDPPRISMTLGAGDTAGTVNFVEAVIHGKWKLINGSQPCSWSMWQGPMYPNMTAHQMKASKAGIDCLHKKSTFLFNIRDDPHETTNLAHDNPLMLEILVSRLRRARAEYAAMPRLEADDKLFIAGARCRPSAWSSHGPPGWVWAKPNFTTQGCGQFHTDHDRGDRDKEMHCEAFTKENGGFLGPYMEGRLVQHFQVERRSRLHHPLAFADPDVYTDD
jgi:arylsulfatase I/J